jgi:hypothetical protein
LAARRQSISACGILTRLSPRSSSVTLLLVEEQVNGASGQPARRHVESGEACYRPRRETREKPPDFTPDG